MHAPTDHSHAHDFSDSAGKLSWVLLLVCSFFLVELLGGWWTNSLALLADAGHMFSDLTALSLSLFAAWLRKQPPRGQRTFGYQRIEILTALFNGGLLLVLVGSLLTESWERFQNPAPVLAGPMFWIACSGLVINLISLRVLHGDHAHDLNVRSAWLHVLGDTLGSVAVILAALAMWLGGWHWADPLASLLVSVLLAIGAVRLIGDTFVVLMEQAPNSLPVNQIREILLSVPDVASIHCLHVWTVSSGLNLISAHLVLERGADPEVALRSAHARLREQLPVQHITLQIETAEFPYCEEAIDCLQRSHQPAVDHDHPLDRPACDHDHRH